MYAWVPSKYNFKCKYYGKCVSIGNGYCYNIIYAQIATPSSMCELYFDGTQVTCSFVAFGGSCAHVK